MRSTLSASTDTDDGMTSSGVVTRDEHLWAGQPDEVAALMSWPSSDEPSTINGAIISAYGGWSA